MSQVTRIKRASPGGKIRARDYNQAPDLLNKQRGIRPPSQVDEYRGVGRVRRFEIVAVQGDYLECVPAGAGQETDETFFVARPYLLQRSRTSHNGVDFTYTDDQTRTADDGSTTETQKVVPTYAVGDEIIGCRVIGSAGVETETADGGAVVAWMDMNFDGRFWAEEA